MQLEFSTEEQAAYYLAAMIDGEGWVGEPKPANPYANRAIRIANTEKELIEACAACCDVLGVKYRLSFRKRPAKHQHWNDTWWLEIYGREHLSTIHKKVPFISDRKRDRLTRSIKSYREPLNLPSEVVLREMYFEQGLTVREIAEQLGMPFKRIYGAMKKYGVERRSGGGHAAWRRRREIYGQSGRR